MAAKRLFKTISRYKDHKSLSKMLQNSNKHASDEKGL